MNFIKKIKPYFLKNEDGKSTLRKRRTIFVSSSFVLTIIIVLAYQRSQVDGSFVRYSNDPVAGETNQVQPGNGESETVQGLLGSSGKGTKKNTQRQQAQRVVRSHRPINYKATQVIERKDGGDLNSGLPIGTNLVGKLLTAIDTRETGQLYKVLLPYGGQDKNGGSIPKNSILFGKIRYPGQGQKVFLQLTKALLPDGEELKINAQVLSSKDYSPGILGELNGRSLERSASTLGLTMVSAMADTLTEREALGGGNMNGMAVPTEVTPKATAKNALYQGISKVSQVETQRQASQLANMKEYVTVPIGQELIVNLVATYHGN